MAVASQPPLIHIEFERAKPRDPSNGPVHGTAGRTAGQTIRWVHGIEAVWKPSYLTLYFFTIRCNCTTYQFMSAFWRI